MTFTLINTLEEIEGIKEEEPQYDSYVVRTCHLLRKKPLIQFSIEDLRIMIGQGFSLSTLAPLALEILERDPFAEGHFGSGDLYKAVQTIPQEFWNQHPPLFQTWQKIPSPLK